MDRLTRAAAGTEACGACSCGSRSPWRADGLSMLESLKGKVVLVTGAAKRIGRGIAVRLSNEGARVVIHYHRSEAEARDAAAEAGGAELLQANLESVPEIVSMFRDIRERVGRLDGLVNNAARFTRID